MDSLVFGDIGFALHALYVDVAFPVPSFIPSGAQKSSFTGFGVDYSNLEAVSLFIKAFLL